MLICPIEILNIKLLLRRLTLGRLCRTRSLASQVWCIHQVEVLVVPVVEIIGVLRTVSKGFAERQEYPDIPYITCWEWHIFSERCCRSELQEGGEMGYRIPSKN